MIGVELPELPEVETVVRGLREHLAGRTITGVEVFWPRSIAAPAPDVLAAELPGRCVRAVDRRGKFIVLRLDRGDLLVHLRMTGQLLVMPGGQAHSLRHVRVAMSLGELRLLFNDSRKFGRIALVPNAAEWLSGLGPEPFDPRLTADALHERLRGRRLAIKALLLDQRWLAGVGNIYADEALHAAHIAPQRPACALTHAEAEALLASLRSKLEEAIEHRGTTLSDYRDADGQSGQHQRALRVYGRAGEACSCCGCTIARVRLNGRSSYYCPHCQQ